MTSEKSNQPSSSASDVETVLEALRRQEVDAIVGDSHVLLLRLREVEKSLRESEARLRELNRTLEARIDERTAALEQQTFRLRKLNQELTHAEQRERKRLAQILHDGLQQLLIAAEINLSMVQDENDSEELELALNLVRKANETSRNMAYELAPPVLYESPFSEALAWLARWFTENSNFHVTVNIESDIPRLAENTKVFLFNIVRELLMNSLKHSGTDRATVYCTKNGEHWWELEVHDTGRGFDPLDINRENKANGGFGLHSIRERLLALGGEMTIESKPGEGSHFYIRLPVSMAELDQLP